LLLELAVGMGPERTTAVHRIAAVIKRLSGNVIAKKLGIGCPLYAIQ
jgi:hypothetical protein